MYTYPRLNQQFDIVKISQRKRFQDKWARNGDIARNCCFVSATICVSFSSLSLSLSPGVPKFFQLRIIIFPGMSRRCLLTPSSKSLISGKFFSRFPLENTTARVSPPHPFSGSSTQKNFNSASEKSRMTTCSSTFARETCTSKDYMSIEIKLQTGFVEALPY